jgi:hypothetical protein
MNNSIKKDGLVAKDEKGSCKKCGDIDCIYNKTKIDLLPDKEHIQGKGLKQFTCSKTTSNFKVK